MNTNVRNIIVNYFKNQPVEKAWLFGSYSRGEETEDSDVDILVTFKSGERIGLKYAAMICDLEDLLHKKVDMVVEGTLLPFAQKSADSDKVLIYERGM
ncbi:MAG: nucleotidyltransferase domain-containing protein [Paludibacteraceae bacterium]|nr:nucleotidyltransferase domain-containing protein [Paludibacteraceae bacterium]MBP5481426.1 nucleotidyltransferase domain-containing protein [Paludibacteraceae bacterium]MBR5373060.1 nucleotidyltransferase domain-containing protein [Paludibacteraceae bacterium]